MAAAKAAAAEYRSTAPRGRIPQLQGGAFASRVANDAGNARKLTMAARNGGKQSERDLKGVEEDFAELNRLRKFAAPAQPHEQSELDRP
ncbi:hypothetical protein, partial [Roseomonas chloroacetimidivorans]|uniref:hypothetical protein n=1 Tax=Roseomonas chloroacetimidivorans TaxID=1766656 RepID=UPI003C766D70